MEDEKELIRQACLGDREAFGGLYDLYIGRIYNFVYYRVASKEMAEDLTSDIFFKALSKISSFNPEKENSSFSAWLYRIARNRIIDSYRSKKPTVSLEDSEDELSDSGAGAEELMSRFQREAILKYLDVLKSEQKEIVLMRVWDELSYKEIAEITGKSEASLKMSFSRTIQILREKMPADLLTLILLINLIK